MNVKNNFLELIYDNDEIMKQMNMNHLCVAEWESLTEKYKRTFSLIILFRERYKKNMNINEVNI